MPTFDANLIAQWTGGRWLSNAPACIRGISIDSRSLSAGNLFVAIRGVRYDGHCFVRQAFEKGAVAAVVCNDAIPGMRQAPSCAFRTRRRLCVIWRLLIGAGSGLQ